MPSFKFICLVLQKKIVKVLAIYGHGGHLGHVTETIFIKSYAKLFQRKRCLKIMVVYMHVALMQWSFFFFKNLKYSVNVVICSMGFPLNDF